MSRTMAGTALGILLSTGFLDAQQVQVWWEPPTIRSALWPRTPRGTRSGSEPWNRSIQAAIPIRAETNAYATNPDVYVADARMERHSLGANTRRPRAQHRTDRSFRSREDCGAIDGRHPRRARTVSPVL